METLKSKKIVVDSSAGFRFPQPIVKKFGKYKIIPNLQTSALPEKFEFCLDDTEFVFLCDDPEQGSMLTGNEYRQKILNSGFVPLDAYCANALYADSLLLQELHTKWFWDAGGLRSGKDLRTLSFFGSMVQPDGTSKGRVNAVSFSYEMLTNKVTFTPYEANDSWFVHQDHAIVFKKQFIQNLK
jgi:hypothetical protein